MRKNRVREVDDGHFVDVTGKIFQNAGENFTDSDNIDEDAFSDDLMSEGNRTRGKTSIRSPKNFNALKSRRDSKSNANESKDNHRHLTLFTPERSTQILTPPYYMGDSSPIMIQRKDSSDEE